MINLDEVTMNTSLTATNDTTSRTFREYFRCLELVCKTHILCILYQFVYISSLEDRKSLSALAGK